MSEDLTTLQSDRPTPSGDPLSETDLDTLRRLLLGPEYQSVLQTNVIVNDPEKLGELIVPAITQALQVKQSSSNFQTALTPTVVNALMDSVSDDPKPIADALYPVMGPAIRKSISATMAQMTSNFNELLEQSVSPKAWGWRFDAWRTGRNYSEVVLIKNLIYQVEQVFLIHRETGLLLQHVVAVDAISKDPDMVSGMLTAIQDFTSDSFTIEQNSGLNSLKLGDLTVLIENGPPAVVAAVVRGAVPTDMQNKLSEVIEEVHLLNNKKLVNYKGDSSHFDHLQPLLSECLKTQLMNKRKKKKEKTKQNKFIKPAIYVSLLALVFAYGYNAYTNLQETKEWQNVQSVIKAEPGVIITQTSGANGEFIISGLADPLAKNPSLLIKHGTLNNIEVELDFKPYLSMDSEIIQKRLKRRFNIPDSVNLKLKDSVLTLVGRSTQIWLDKFEKEVSKTDGIASLDIKKLTIVSGK
jgi:OOP family OmpA-OmpF porin